MSDEPLFIRQPPCQGPWNPKSLSGRVVVALCGFQIEQSHELRGYVPARLTVDMYRLPGFAPIEVATRVVREGARIKVIDAEFISGGVSYARASSQWLKRTANAEGNVWSPPSWEVPAPEALADTPHRMPGSLAMRNISGAYFTSARKRLWLRDDGGLVGG